MTVQATTRRAGPYVGNGVTTVFPFDFKVFTKSDVAVVLTDANGAATTLVLDSDYSITLNLDQAAAPGGSITYPLVGPPLASPSIIAAIGALEYKQLTDITNVGRFNPDVIETALDYQTILVQQLDEVSKRTLRAAIGTTVDLVFPAPSSGKFIRWNAALTGLENVEAGTDSMVLQGLLADAAVVTRGAAMLGHKLNATGAVGRTLAAKLADTISVKDFGAVGNGVTDDTAAIQVADAYARATKSSLYFPDGTYMVSQLVVYTGAIWVGEGRDSTIIKQIIGSNTDLLYGDNSNSNWDRTSGNPPTLIVNGYTLMSLTLNGNWNAGAGNTSGSGLAIYGSRPIVRDLFITNCAEYGMRTEYIDSAAGGIDTWTMEGHIDNVRIDMVGKHGWMNKGPHDTVTKDMIVVDAGQLATNTWDGIYLGLGSSGKLVSCHAWNRSSAARHRYALNCDVGSLHEFTGGCHFEGAYSAVVQILGSGNVFDPSTRIYSAWNGVTVFMGGTCTLNRVEGYLEDPGLGRPVAIGVLLGSLGSDFVANNTIDLTMRGQNSSLASFQFSGGKNYVRIRGYQTAGATFVGVPHATDVVDIQNAGHAAALDKAPIRPIAWCTFEVSGGTVTLRSKYNVSSVTRASAGNFTVNFASSVKNNVLGVSISNDFGAGANAIHGFRPYGNSATSQDISFRQAGGTFADPAMATVMFFQD